MEDGYQMWLDYCLKKYNTEYLDDRKHYDVENEPFGAEFSEEGGIYLHGVMGTLFIFAEPMYSLLYYETQVHDFHKGEE